MRDSCGFAVSVPDYVKRSCGFARIRPVPGRLWGVFCCAPTRGRKRYAQDVVIRTRLRETFVRFCTYSSRSGSFVERIQYAPTRGRKRYAQDVVIHARVHETFVRFCTYSPRSGSFVGRMQYAPTRGRKRYAQDVVIRARVHETVVRVLLFIDI